MANIGAIPGFYYDTEKGKYFKITANHAAPPEAKHSLSNVRREARETKKRKLDDRKQQKAAKQTVQRSRISRDALCYSSLSRELGQVSASGEREAAFIKNLRPERIIVPQHYGESVSVLDVQPLSDGRVGMAVSRGGRAGCSVLSTTWPMGESGWPQPTISFVSDLVSLHMISENSDSLPAYAVVTQEPKGPGNLFIANLPSAAVHADVTRSNLFKLGEADTSLWASSLSTTREQLAISGTADVFLADLTVGDVISRLPLARESRDIAWLDASTIAYDGGSNGGVGLWDVRSQGRATRWKRAKKTAITGILSPNRHGVQVVVGGNTGIDVYDTRYAGKEPLLAFGHVHQGPQQRWTINNDLGVITAVDRENDIQCYGLRSGKPLGRLTRPQSSGKGMWKALRWLEGETVLQACRGDEVVRWRWGGGNDDEG
ncbi:hypothetical protein LTR56_023821 [Elasticomyces elasticus]|nr:hypothetical protein LTR56_023821 [Elasticomyces elasticus]KAK3624444.1 hypothetical protein LTR22_023977 [Elasticomyces elasticus]KAK4906422.1 hypothetical protein LTR49_024444 [Elasticomyces elasticus]KAK5747355.1 hypothetical protein LTS12_022410 [Elasticomyces elasticus]